MPDDILQRLEKASGPADRRWLATQALVGSLPKEVQSLVWAAAVPHWFDDDLLAALRPELQELIPELIKRLHDLAIVEPCQESGHSVVSVVREAIVERYWRARAIEHLDLSRRAVSWLRSKLAEPIAMARESSLQHWSRSAWFWGPREIRVGREILYHALVCDFAEAPIEVRVICDRVRNSEAEGFNGLDELVDLVLRVGDGTEAPLLACLWGLHWKGVSDAQRLDFTAAKSTLRTVLSLTPEQGSRELKASTYGALGFVHAQSQEWKQAQTCFDEAILLAGSLGSGRLLDAALAGLLQVARLVERDDERVRLLCQVGRRMPRDVALQVFSEALQAARAMRPAERSAEALREIVQSLPSGANELVAEVLHVASLVGEAGPIANVLGISRSDQPFDPSTQSTMSILIVDADNFLRAGLRTFLQDQGFDVIEARDMATAAAIAATSVIDAAIIEVSIPLDEWSRKWERNAFGIDLARRLKAAQPDLGVVFQTAYADQLDSFLLLISEGIRGLAYCLKGGWQQSDLLKMIAYARSGGVFISPEVHSRRPVVRDALLEALSDTERPWVERALAAIPTLSGQEMRAASLLAAAVSADSVARQLSIQRADTLIGRVYDKLGLNGLLLDKHDLSPMPLLIKALDIHGLDK